MTGIRTWTRSQRWVIALVVLPPHLGFAMELRGQANEPPRPIPQQDVDLSGIVVDRTTGEAVPSVRVLLHPDDPFQRRDATVERFSGPDGRFRFGQVSRGVYQIRTEALGFSDVSRTMEFWEASAVTVRLELPRDAVALEPVVVTATRLRWLDERGFYDRRSLGQGYSLTRSEIEARNPVRVSDLLFGVPGVRVNSERTGSRPAGVRLRGGCNPEIVLDGAPFSTAADIAIDRVVSVSELEAIEVHHGASNAARFSSTSCGTIMVWTRRSMGPGRALSWQRLLAAAGVLTMFVFSVK